MKRTAKKLITALTAVFLAVFSVFSTPLSAVAEDSTSDSTSLSTTVRDYDKTDIVEDLKNFDDTNYKYKEDGVPEVISFQEWCYSNHSFYKRYYGLYIYIYNPTAIPLKETRNYQKVNMATAYDANWEPTSYEPVRLTFCDRTSDYLFYKFRVADTDENYTFWNMANNYAQAHDGTRRYDMASLQLTHIDDNDPNTEDTYDTTTKDYNWAKTYYFTGFAKGCGADPEAESTLECSVEGLKTVKLKVNHTNWRGDDTSNTEAYELRDQINTAYFSVPNAYFEEYGGLQKIKAEWYEYKTKEIFATNDQDAYDVLFAYIGKNIGEKDDTLSWQVLWEEIAKYSGVSGGGLVTSYSAKVKAYNKIKSFFTDSDATNITNYTVSDYIPIFYWLFLITEADEIVSGENIATKAKEYTEKFATENSAYTENGKYLLDLFEDSIDEDRLSLLEKNKNESALDDVTSGYVCQEIDAEDEEEYLEEKDQSWWDKFWHGVQYETGKYNPIVVLGKDEYETISNMSDAEFAEEYKVDKIDAKNVREYCINQISLGNKAVLFRFAKTDYYSSDARFDYFDKNAVTQEVSDVDGYVAQETVFLDFDIISLTFRLDEKEDTVIAVVSDPLDIFAGTQPPDGKEDNKGAIVGLIAGIITLFIFVAVLVVVGIYYPPVGNFMLNALGKILRFLWEVIKYLSIAVWRAIVFLCTWLIYKPIKGMINGIAYLLDNPSENKLPLAKKQNESESKPVAKKSVKKKTSSGKAPVRRKKK